MDNPNSASSEVSREPQAPSAGPELNALVAERVMGWDGVTRGIMHNLVGTRPDGLCLPVPDFSGDISHTWMVVENMRERCLNLTLHCLGDEYHASFQHIYKSRLGPRGIGEYAPEAICRAALAALPADATGGSRNSTPEAK